LKQRSVERSAFTVIASPAKPGSPKDPPALTNSIVHEIEPDKRHIVPLDGLRGFAVLAVMAHHFSGALPSVGILTPIKGLAYFGWTGVDIFFVLSGFLITGVLLGTRESKNYYSSFYGRRVLRIAPIYYLVLLIVFASSRWLSEGLDRIPAPAEWPAYFLYLTNWIAVWKGHWPSNVVGHFWSLAIEEQFYLVWPFIVAAVAIRSIRNLAVGIAIFELVLRITLVALNRPLPVIDYSSLTHSDGLAIGAFCAVLFATRKDAKGLRLSLWALIPLTIFATCCLALPDPGQQMRFILSFGFSLVAISAGGLVLYLAYGEGPMWPVRGICSSAAMRKIGRYSYGMYVYHIPLLMLAEFLIYRRIYGVLNATPLLACLYVLGLGIATYLVAMLSYECFEKPILSLKRYLRAENATAKPEVRRAS